MPELYIITGSNGAGKSTIGTSYLPANIRDNYTVFDGDKLFMQKQKELWASGITAVKEAKNIAIAYVRETFDNLVLHALTKNETFVYEGHFTNDATWEIPKRFKDNGYQINMIFFGLNSPDLSELRVIDRSKEGGHYVPRATIEDNFYGNLEKLDKYAGLIDNLTIVDTSETSHIVLANFLSSELSAGIDYDNLPEWFVRYLPKLSRKILLKTPR